MDALPAPSTSLRPARRSSRCCCSRSAPGCSAPGSCCAASRSTPTRSAGAAFPGLVLADGLGFAAPLGAFGAALPFAPRSRALAGRGAPRLRRHDGARPGGGARARRDPRERRLPLGRQRRDPAVRQPAPGGPRDLVCRRRRARPRWRRPLCSGVRGSRRVRPERRARARGARRAVRRGPAGLIALVVVAALSAVGALLATHCSSCRPRRRASGSTGWALAARDRRARCGEGVVGVWLSVELNAPPGATIATLAGGVFAARAPRAAPHARAVRRGRGALGAAARPRARPCGDGDDRERPAWSRPRPRSPTGRGSRGRRVERPSAPASRTPTRTSTSRARPTSRRSRGADVSSSGDDLDGWVDEIVDDAGSDADVVDLEPAACRTRAGRAARSTRTGGTTLATCARRRRDREALVARPATARHSSTAARALLRRRSARARPRVGRCLRRSRGRAQARHRPRRVRLLRRPLRARGGRRGDPGADDGAQPSAGELARLADTIRASGCGPCSRRAR